MCVMELCIVHEIEEGVDIFLKLYFHDCSLLLEILNIEFL